MSFRSPKRRLTSQRSGFSVSGSTTGGECKIFKTQGIKTDKKEIEFTFEKNVKLASSFGSALGFVAIGGYVHCESDLTIKKDIYVFGISKIIGDFYKYDFWNLWKIWDRSR